MMICVVVLPSGNFVCFDLIKIVDFMSGRFTGEINMSTLVLPSLNRVCCFLFDCFSCFQMTGRFTGEEMVI